MKEKIIAELRKKFAGLSNDMLGLIADKLAAKVTTETEIQGAIDELDNAIIPVTDYAAMLQREGDRRATAATATHERTLREKFNFVDKPGTPPATPPGGGGENVPAEFKTQFEDMARRLQQMEQRDTQQRLSDTFVKKLTEKGIPVAFAKGRIITEESQLESILAEVETDFAEVKQTLVNTQLAGTTPPAGGAPNAPAKAVDSEIAAWGAPKTTT